MATRITLVPPPSFEPVPIRIAGYPGAGPAEARGSSDSEAPPEAVSAYAATKDVSASAPLAPAKDALPLKGRSRAALRARALEAKAALAHARLQAHTQVVSEEGDGKTAAPAPAKGKAAHLRRGAVAAKVHAHAKQSAAKGSPAKVLSAKGSSVKPHGGAAVAKAPAGAKKAAARDE